MRFFRRSSQDRTASAAGQELELHSEAEGCEAAKWDEPAPEAFSWEAPCPEAGKWEAPDGPQPAATSGCPGLLDGADPARLRAAARLAMAAGVTALLLAPLGSHHHRLLLAGFAFAATLLANGGLISFATSHGHDGRYMPMTSAEVPARLDTGTCALGYAMVPVTMISVICLAVYKADADRGGQSAGRTQATQHAAVAFLRFVGCGDLMEAEDNLHRENTALMLQGKFLGIALLGAVFYLAVLGVRAICTEKGPGALEETTCMRTARQAMRLAFGAATVLLVFGAAGFSPAPCCWAACGISLASSVGMLASISESPPFQELHSTFRTQLQAHCFNTVTLCCIDGLGCVLLQQFTLDERYSKWEIKVRIVGFQLAFSAAVWFAVILAARDLIKTKLSQ